MCEQGPVPPSRALLTPPSPRVPVPAMFMPMTGTGIVSAKPNGVR
jgi:hypothetical protein